MAGNMRQLKDGKTGGILVGRTHKECNTKGDCGIKMKNVSTGEPIEAQHGEVIVMAEAVDSPEKHDFDGRKMTNREILSTINVNAGGVSFMEKGGQVNGHIKCGCSGKKHHYNGEELTDREIVNRMAAGGTIDSKTAQAARARKADLIILPEAVQGTNCSNCQFVEIIDKNAGTGYCQHPQVRQMVTARMCCIFWDAPGTQRVADQLTGKMNQGGRLPAPGNQNFVPPALQVENRFLPLQLEYGAILPDALNETEKKVIEHFRPNPFTYVQLFNHDRSDIAGLIQGGVVFTSGKTNTGHMDVFLTDAGRKLLFPLRAEAGALLKPAAPLVLKRGGTTETNKYFKGTDAAYTNPYEVNRAIEELLDSRPAPATDFSSEEKQFMGYYTGYGGLEKFGAEGAGLLYEYYTPVPVIEKMWGLAYKYGYKGGPILEPACGIGDFFKFLPEQHSQATGYEINKYSARIAAILYPHVTIENKYFEELFIKNRNTIRDKTDGLKKFSLVIGNPPYGNFQGKFAGMGEKQYTKASNYIDYFIFRGLDLLEPGGLLTYLVGAEVQAGGVLFLAQKMNAIKKQIAAKSVLLDAYKLPNGIFERTDVLTEIIVLQKQ